MNITKFTQSRHFTIVIVVIAVLLGLLLVFGLGVSVGFHKARFSYQWGENYDRNFGGPKHGIIGMFGGGNYMNSHGIFGSIIKIDSSAIAIKGRDNVERTIIINNNTIIRRGNENIKLDTLKADDNVVVIGSPDETGQIQAKLMRVLPPMLPLPSMSPRAY